jgi:ribonucleoside-triphosphate reductase
MPKNLDNAYQAIIDEDNKYSAELEVPFSIRHTVVKPSGTMGKALDCDGEEGIHAALAPHIIQRIQFAANDPALPQLRAAGHFMEPLKNFDGSTDPRTMVVDFYVAAPEGAPTVETGWDTWKQLDTVLMAQRYWADQSVSVTVYYKIEELAQLKTWLAENIGKLKTISFLKFSGHGFVQAPKEPITKEQFDKLSSKIKSLEDDNLGDGVLQSSLECEGGVCPVK